MTYAEKLLDPRWQKRRLEILQRDKFACQWCEATDKTLHIHHLEYYALPWEAKGKDLITLCESCHKITHFTLPAIVEQILKELFKSDNRRGIKTVVQIIHQYLNNG